MNKYHRKEKTLKSDYMTIFTWIKAWQCHILLKINMFIWYKYTDKIKRGIQ